MRALLGVVVLALACVASPARADATYGSVTGVNGVLFHGCLDYPYRWAVNVPDDARYRALRTALVAPDGTVAGMPIGYVVVDANVASGTSSFRLCQETHRYGTYTVRATVEWGPSPESIAGSSRLDDSRFRLRKPATRTSVSASTRRPHHGQVVRYRIATHDERPGGFGANAFAWVHLERKAHGHWVRMKGGRGMTHSTGRVKLRLRYPYHHERLLIRAVTEPTVRYARSASPTLRIW
jgi:hypothetical protein